ncbi:NAD(P)H-dependent flavin oxidoreductase [Pseudonocardia sp. GCM10023141]|uniref:NAD(P)H-dependent flavin oxidoreductase n=1 Tax=Pseudonocardia sp. GCM10023141 TaxID=3252653 RepID=UPI00360EC5FE
MSEAGGLGTLSSPTASGAADGARELRAAIDECAGLTSRPFAVNIPVDDRGHDPAQSFTRTFLEVVFQARAADSAVASQLRAITTAAGDPGAYVAVIKDNELVHQHKVGSTRQACKAEARGVDVIIASGAEMGGHTHARPVHTVVLGPNVTEAVDVPVVLSGGFRDGRGLAAALCFGAEGVAMGTRFIASDANTEWHPNYARALLDAQEGDDITYPGFFGPVRGLRNHGSDLLATVMNDGLAGASLHEWKLAAMRKAQAEGDTVQGLVLAGQVAGALTEIVTVAEFVPQMTRDALQILADLARRLPVAHATSAS